LLIDLVDIKRLTCPTKNHAIILSIGMIFIIG
jgi:hypothetical protein